MKRMMNACRSDTALRAIEKAGQFDPVNAEISVILNTVKLVDRARARGNDLFKSERYTEACSAYAEGLRHDPLNPILYCNRAACWFKLGQWEQSVDDCNLALRIQPNYIKALLRRAASNKKVRCYLIILNISKYSSKNFVALRDLILFESSIFKF